MKKTVIIVVGLLLCVVGATVIGQKKNLSPKEERREVREKRRADRIASFEKTMDSVILSRNFQFNPQTMQRQPAGPMRQIMNPAFNVGVWDGTVDICLPYIKGYVPPYYVMILNYTVPNVQGYTTEQTHEGWMVTFSTSLFSASTYTFTFEIFTRTGGKAGRGSAPRRRRAGQCAAPPCRQVRNVSGGILRKTARRTLCRNRRNAVRSQNPPLRRGLLSCGG